MNGRSISTSAKINRTCLDLVDLFILRKTDAEHCCTNEEVFIRQHSCLIRDRGGGIRETPSSREMKIIESVERGFGHSGILLGRGRENLVAQEGQACYHLQLLPHQPLPEAPSTTWATSYLTIEVTYQSISHFVPSYLPVQKPNSRYSPCGVFELTSE